MAVFFPYHLLLLLPLSVFLCQCTVSTTKTTACVAPRNPSLEFHSNCTVRYTDTLVLQFWNGSASEASWYKEGKNNTKTIICDQCPKHNVTHQLTLLDSGMYLCEVPQSQERHNSYYINVTVQGPPVMQGEPSNPLKCDEDRQHCTYPGQTVPYTNTASLEVEYLSIGNTNVQWSMRHKDIDCGGDDDGTMKCNQKTTTSTSTLTILRPYFSAYSGDYWANVSNEYGWNSSRINLWFDCYPQTNPVNQKPKNMTQPLPFLDSAQVQCSDTVLDEADLFMCYRHHDQPFNFSTDCVTCYGYYEGRCNGTILTRPGWEVARYRSPECDGEVSTTLSIPRVSLGDAGLVECFWMSAGGVFSKNSHLYMRVSISVDKSKLWYTITGVLVGVALTLAVIFVVAKKIHRAHRRRHSQVHNNIESTVCVHETFSTASRPCIIVTGAGESTRDRSAIVSSGLPTETTPLLTQERRVYMHRDDLSPTGSFISTVSDTNVELEVDENVPSTII